MVDWGDDTNTVCRANAAAAEADAAAAALFTAIAAAAAPGGDVAEAATAAGDAAEPPTPKWFCPAWPAAATAAAAIILARLAATAARWIATPRRAEAAIQNKLFQTNKQTKNSHAYVTRKKNRYTRKHIVINPNHHYTR